MIYNKRLVSVFLVFVFILSFSAPAFAGRIECEGYNYDYDDELMIYPDYREVVDKMKKYAEKGDLGTVAELYSELITLLSKYELLKQYAKLPDREDAEITIAECEFDRETGTILKVTNDARSLYIPSAIDGVPVTYIAEGAIEGKQELYMLFIPPSIRVIDCVIVKNCPKFSNIYNMRTPLKAVFFENCPSYVPENIVLQVDSTISHLYNTVGGPHAMTTNLGMGFALDSGVIKGDEKGNYNWDDCLTRTEATIMILRLMGLEDEAALYSGKPCSFTDVPEWAKGYITLAVEKGVVKGRSENYFGSNEQCSAQDFLTMLFRLTDLTEGEDFSWQTIVNDYAEALSTLDNRLLKARRSADENSFYYSESVSSPAYHASSFTNYHYSGGEFTRRIASIVVFYMLDIVAGEDDLSFADILSERYNMPDYILYNYYARRTEASVPKNADKFSSYDIAICFADNEKAMLYARNCCSFSSPDEINPDIKALAESIASGKKSEYDKAKAISKWISEHIYYDHDYLNNRNRELFSTAEDVLEHRYTVCEGYASLTTAMLNSIGIECYTLNSLNHAWNIACLDGNSVLIDNTWDSPLALIEGKFYKDYDSFYGSGSEAKNINEPGAKWYNEFFDSEPEAFYKSNMHKPVRNPRIILSNNRM